MALVLHSHCFQYHLGITVIKKRNHRQWLCKFWGLNKVHYELSEIAELNALSIIIIIITIIYHYYVIYLFIYLLFCSVLQRDLSQVVAQ